MELQNINAFEKNKDFSDLDENLDDDNNSSDDFDIDGLIAEHIKVESQH